MKIKCFRFHLCVEKSLFMDFAEEVFNIKVDELEKQKHDLFISALKKATTSLEDSAEKGESSYSARLIYEKGNRLLVRFGKLKKESIVQNDFVSHKSVVTWNQYINIFIDASSNYQLIGIEQDQVITYKQFDNLLANKIKKELAESQIDFDIVPISSYAQFWDFVEQHKGNIKTLKVNLNGENMSAFDPDVASFLKTMRSDTKADLTCLELSAKGGLNISHESKGINSIEKIGREGIGRVEMTACVDNQHYKYNSDDEKIGSYITKESESLDNALTEGSQEEIEKEANSIFVELEKAAWKIKPHD